MMPDNTAQNNSMTCNCECHVAADGFVNPDMDGCTAAMCQCGRRRSLRPVNVFAVSSSGSHIGLINQHTAFKPINCNRFVAPFNDDNADMRDRTLKFFKHNNLCYDSSKALSHERTNNTRDIVQTGSRPDNTQTLGIDVPRTQRTPLITPNDFLLNKNCITPTSSVNSNSNDRVSSKRSIFPEVLPTAEGRGPPFVDNYTGSARSGSLESSRTTPITVEDCTTRLMAPHEFLSSTSEFPLHKDNHGNSYGSQLQSTLGQHRDKSRSLQENTLSQSNGVIRYRPRSTLSTDLNSGLSSMVLGAGKPDTDNPLSAFCNKIGITPDHNSLLPTLPGGSEIKHRLAHPDPDVVEKFLQNKDGTNSAENDTADPRVINQTLISLDEMHYRTPDGEQPYIAVFWDIENCQVPRNMDASSIVRSVRNKFFGHHVEYEFFVVMDVSQEKEEINKELQRAQATIVHVSKGEKNAADEKLLYLMRRFSHYHKTGNTCILISGDTNFASVLHDMRHKNHINIILLHNNVTNDILKALAHFTFNFSIVTEDGVLRPGANPVPRQPLEVEYHTEAKFLAIHGLPNMDYKLIKNKLHMLCENLGGKVFQVYAPHAFIDMRDANAAIRAKSRLDGETVYQNQICCTITSACSLNNFHQAQVNGTVQHSCAIDENISLHDNNCPRFNAPHNTHNYNKQGNHGGLQGVGWGQGGNGGQFRGQVGGGFGGSNGGAFGGNGGEYGGNNSGGFTGNNGGGFTGNNGGGFTGNNSGGFGGPGGAFGVTSGGFGAGSGGFVGTNAGRGNGIYASGGGGGFGGGGDPSNYSSSKKGPNSYGGLAADRGSALPYPRQNSVPSDDFQPFDLLDDGGLRAAFLAGEGRNGGSPAINGATNRHYNGGSSARKAGYPGNNRPQGNGYYQNSYPINVPNPGGFFDSTDDTLPE